MKQILCLIGIVTLLANAGCVSRPTYTGAYYGPPEYGVTEVRTYPARTYYVPATPYYYWDRQGWVY